MNDYERKTIEGKAILKYGKNRQLLKCIEEMSELTKELVKDLIDEGNLDHIVEEYCDLIITLDELQMIYGITTLDMNEWMDKKLLRLKKRMDKDAMKDAPIEHSDGSVFIDMAYDK